MNALRFDRLLTLSFFNPLKGLITSPLNLRIPILMYHSVSMDGNKKVHPYYQTVTLPTVFEEQMRLLHEKQYNVIDLDKAIELINSGSFFLKENGSKCRVQYVVITFDDGFRDFYTEAFPILQKYGFAATVFLPTSYISNNRCKFKDKECLTWSEVLELNKAGITFGSHTSMHPQLRYLTDKEIRNEIEFSKKDIELNIGETVKFFSYPYAFPEDDRNFSDNLRIMLKDCGYMGGVSTRLGTVNNKDDIFFLKRIPVNSCDDSPLFRAKIKGGYDWLQKVQYISKVLKNKAS